MTRLILPKANLPGSPPCRWSPWPIEFDDDLLKVFFFRSYVTWSNGVIHMIRGLLILWMEEILHHSMDGLSHYFWGFNHPRWCRISSIHRMSRGWLHLSIQGMGLFPLVHLSVFRARWRSAGSSPKADGALLEQRPEICAAVNAGVALNTTFEIWNMGFQNKVCWDWLTSF